MSTENSVEKGSKLTRSSKRQIRREVVDAARRTGARAFQFAWDGDQKVQITGFPNGRATQEPVLDNGASIEPRQLLTALGVPARWLGVASAAVVLIGEVLRVALS
jgi:hypothetical protein